MLSWHALCTKVTLSELDIEPLSNHRQHYFHADIGESFAKAGSLATVEGEPGERAALLATRSLR